MRSQIYGYLMILGLVLLQIGCCERMILANTKLVAPPSPITLRVNVPEYISAPNQTVSVGDALTIEVPQGLSVDTSVTLVLTASYLGRETQKYNLLSSDLRSSDLLTVHYANGDAQGSRIITLKGTISQLQTYLNSLQHTLHADVQPNQAVAVRASLSYVGTMGSEAMFNVRNAVETPLLSSATPIPPANTPSATVRNPNNIPPINTVPGTQGVNHRQPHVMNFLVDDPDVGENLMTITIEVSKGTLTVIPAGGAGIAGNNSGYLQILGPLSGINATLLGADGVGLADGVIYHYTGDHLPEGSAITDTLTFTSRDNWGGTAVNSVILEISNPSFSIFVPPILISPTPPISCVELDTAFIHGTMFGDQDLNFDLSAGVTDAGAVHPLTFVIGGLPTGFSVNGSFLQANVGAVASYETDLEVRVNVTDGRGCAGSYDLRLVYD